MEGRSKGWDGERSDERQCRSVGIGEGRRNGDWGPCLGFIKREVWDPILLSFSLMPAVRLTTRRRRSSHAICRFSSFSLCSILIQSLSS